MRLSFRRQGSKAAGAATHPRPASHPLPEYVPTGSTDPLAEVTELMDRNRLEADPAAEKRIVQLRHEAFATLDLSVPEAPPVTGEAAGTLLQPDGLPEIDSSELSAEAVRDGILGGGSLLIRGLLDPERAERMRWGIDETFAQRDAHLDGADVAETTPWFDPFAPGPDYPLDPAQWNRMKRGGHAVWAPDSPRMMFELLDGFEATGLTRVITEYLGERPVLSMNKSVLRRVSPDSGTDWHQDGAFLGRGIRTCNVWVALSRCGDLAPGLDIVSRRYEQIVETGTEGATFPWAVSPDKVDESRDGARIARPIFEPGDAVLFDHLCLHRTAVGPEMTGDRYATETWCFAPSVYPDKTVPLVL